MPDDPTFRDAIVAEGLTKRFGAHEALRGIDLAVPAGTVFGVLGPNGAGKTTTVRILTTLLEPDGGHATVAGLDVVRDARRVRRTIGLAGQHAAVDERLTGRENLQLIGRLLHLGRRAAAARAAELLERFDLTDAADRPSRTYSGGMRRRLDLAGSLVGQPKVLFLDEPTTGLDLTSRRTLWTMIREQVDAGVTVLLTTQYLEEADVLADRIAVIDKGAVIAEGTPGDLKRAVGGDRLEVTLTGLTDVPAVERALAAISPQVPVVDADARRVSVPLLGGMAMISDAAAALTAAGVEPEDFAVRRSSLDDVFLALTGRGVDADVPTDVADGVDAEADAAALDPVDTPAMQDSVA